jgi:hypothetical protein
VLASAWTRIRAVDGTRVLLCAVPVVMRRKDAAGRPVQVIATAGSSSSRSSLSSDDAGSSSSSTQGDSSSQLHKQD